MKKLQLLLITCSLFICGLSDESVYAIKYEETQPIEIPYAEIGFTTVEEAVKEFEHYYQQDLKLPLKVPPLPFTHHFGRFTDLDGVANDAFELEFINEESPESHYILNVRPVQYKIPIKAKYTLKTYKLKNGEEATLINIADSFVALVFERDNWQYMLSIDKRITDKVTPKILVDIANSIDYLGETKQP
ncbi:hypothetical protein RYX56_00050 [Alkalihalophilus lindianensis]|uniref:DUF4367 domain-containing protein n=1 Tax=Alkalihalophilus lindianensis TaxID=1630542 RepID=A0ABU3X4C2_9BACI|nr:hypothetical protein [Alkalihalophilus lindianensis]MDV2682755.1 hypothetical protein [Alkalihalophilus lindianensis]